ncbi:alpha/beta hydrolase [Frankia sp. Ag45/Mut15]|uniref:Alpha/beta hydrolase n=1 Tax=Frankia umida TaxID=573489 RepID=A0ABT0K5R1_9ACTN|nr:alpha/beta hydrolase [Frankia umida]MCK9878847.1 alpha/beta hydrolase [Frankia umida]
MPVLNTRDSTQLFYHDWGTGSPVVLLGAAMMNSRMWESQACQLVKNGLRCVMYDRRGCGRSDWPWDGYDYDTLADDLAQLLDHLDLREVTLVGYAVGGGEAVRYLARNGDDRVARLALVSSTTPILGRRTDHPDGVDTAVLAATIDALERDFARWTSELAGPFFGGAGGTTEGALSSERTELLVRIALDASPRAAAEIYRTLFTADLRADTSAVKLPTLVIHGEADVAAPIELCGRRTAQLVSGSTFVCYENAAHGLFATHADRLSRDLLAFVGAHRR